MKKFYIWWSANVVNFLFQKWCSSSQLACLLGLLQNLRLKRKNLEPNERKIGRWRNPIPRGRNLWWNE